MKHGIIALAFLVGCIESSQEAATRARRWVHENYAAQESVTHINPLPDGHFDVIVPGIQPFTICCGSISKSMCRLVRR